MRRLALACSAGLLALLAGASLATASAVRTEKGTCSTQGLPFRTDPVFLADPEFRRSGSRIQALTCLPERTVELQAGNERVTVATAWVFDVEPQTRDGRGARRNASLVTITLGSEPEVAHRVFVYQDVDVGRPGIVPALALDGETPVVTLGPDQPRAVRLEGGGLVAVDTLAWRSAAAALAPAGTTPGEAVALDLARMEGRVALHRSDADDPQRPASLDEPARALVAALAFEDGALATRAVRVASRETPATALDRGHPPASPLPSGAQACAMSGWLKKGIRGGVPLRAEPSAKARTLVTLPSLRRIHPDDHLSLELSIVGYRDGWFLVDEIEPPVRHEGSLRGLRAYKERGWIEARHVTAQLENTGLQLGELRQAPSLDAARIEARDADGNLLHYGDEPAQVFACSGRWALVETEAGTRGWWRGLCASLRNRCY